MCICRASRHCGDRRWFVDGACQKLCGGLHRSSRRFVVVDRQQVAYNVETDLEDQWRVDVNTDSGWARGLRAGRG